MKKIVFALFAILILATIAMAQGDPELFRSGVASDAFAPTTATKYSNSAGAGTKILIPLAKNVSKFCLKPTAATGIRINNAGSQVAVAANAEYCRSVRKGVTQLQYSSTAAGTVVIEKQY